MNGFGYAAMLACLVENPQVETVEKEWQTASNSGIPPSVRHPV